MKWKYYINISIQSCCIIYMIFNTISPYGSGVPYMFCIYLSACEYEIPWWWVCKAVRIFLRIAYYLYEVTELNTDSHEFVYGTQ